VFSFELLISVITLGSVYALVALGFHLIYRMTGIIDFAQGEKVVLGGMIALTIIGLGIDPLLLVVLIVLCIGLVLGVIYDWAVIRPTSRNGNIAAIAATVGMVLVFANGRNLIWGPDARPFPAMIEGAVKLGGVRVTYQSMVIVAMLLTVAVAVSIFMDRSRVGRGMVAAATDPLAATGVGISVSRSRGIAFALAFGLATVAGILIAPLTLAGGGSMGVALSLKGFTGAVIGGLDSTKGVVIGSLLLGIFEGMAGGFLPSGLVDPVIFGALIVILLILPNGIFGLRRQRVA
jgi:branched-chain amino acid transport system permease protein